jgi:hypothetical protein
MMNPSDIGSEAEPMSQILELPDWVDSALRKAAEASGTTPVEWIAARLVEAEAVTPAKPPTTARTLADLFEGHIGRIQTDGSGRFSERGGANLAEHLESKRESGCL